MASVAPDAAWATCASPANEIEAENCRPGNPPADWEIGGAGDPELQGFSTDISVDQGRPIDFKIDSSSTAYRIEIFRMGYYGGLGARRIATFRPQSPSSSQPACWTDSLSGLVDCSNWSVSASWVVPGDAVSGIYFAVLIREDGTPGASHIVFVVRDDDGRSDLLFQTSDTTWQAYNEYGGNSLYTGSSASPPATRAYKVSYNRPFETRDYAEEDWVFNAEYPMVRWLERNGYDVSYFTGVDSDRYGAELREHRSLLSVGHDEYWSGAQRANWEAARAAGVHMAFFSGNEVFWKTRWENGHRTLVSYKETHAGAKIDPTPGVWTGTWRDPRFGPHDGRPENSLTGQLFTVNDGATTAIQVPAADGQMRFWRHTPIAALGAGQTATLPWGTLGYEWDEDIDNGHRPAGSFRISSTTVTGAPVLVDYGSRFGSGTAVHRMTLYRAASGALVFGAGTVQWPWGLDSNHDSKFGGANEAADVRMQQATANLFGDMGAQGATLQSGLTRPSCSTDTASPTSRITSTAGGTVRGTATDTGGGRVAGVEVSNDGGTTWHPADGRESWSYVPTSGGTNFLSRAVDDTGNLEGRAPVSPGLCSGSGGGGGSTGGGSTGGGSTGGGTSGGSKGGGGGTSGSGDGSRPGTRALVTSRQVRVSSDGLLKLRIKCAGGQTACKISLRLRWNSRTLASRRVVVNAGKRRTVHLYLSRSMRRKLALEQTLRVTAVASVPDRAGHRTVTRTPIRLLASRGR